MNISVEPVTGGDHKPTREGFLFRSQICGIGPIFPAGFFWQTEEFLHWNQSLAGILSSLGSRRADDLFGNI